ncbi:hypothetical protein ACIBSW_39510 [Actinoplanes sp. NPDC049668]|uniref:hypothetical protein n=1 Tax=unclassified Actinoplanes TaxID=2626549 RepID=UPI0033B29717
MSAFKSRVLKGVLATGIATVTGLAIATPAVASWKVTEGSDYATVSTGKTLVTVCDNEADGNGVYAVFEVFAGPTTRVGDGNGSASGCGTYRADNRVRWFKVCEDDAGDDTCSGVKFID